MCACSLATDRLGNWMTASELCSCSCSSADFVANAIRKALLASRHAEAEAEAETVSQPSGIKCGALS